MALFARHPMQLWSSPFASSRCILYFKSAPLIGDAVQLKEVKPVVRFAVCSIVSGLGPCHDEKVDVLASTWYEYAPSSVGPEKMVRSVCVKLVVHCMRKAVLLAIVKLDSSGGFRNVKLVQSAVVARKRRCHGETIWKESIAAREQSVEVAKNSVRGT
jgi:hypothetical protein